MSPAKRVINILVLVCYVGLIYSTLSITPAIYEILNKALGRSFKNAVNLFSFAIILTMLGFFFRRLKYKSIIAYIGMTTIVIVYVYLLIYLAPSIGEKEHLLEYGFLSYLALRVFRDVRSRDLAYICAIITLITIGYFDEFIQGFLPNRAYELRDVYLNVLSGLLGLVVVRLMD